MQETSDIRYSTEKGIRLRHSVVLFAILFFIVFLKLGSFQMRWWDESMFAVNTYEMMHNGKYFSNYYDGVPDVTNTKPPLINWLQILFVKIFGYNETSIRLPSAFAAAITILLVFNFISKRFSLTWAWISALILLTSPGFIGFHTARTGEADSLLTMFLCLSNIYFLRSLPCF